MNLRCFIAIDISEEVRRELSALLAVLEKIDGDIKWVVPANLHITIKFMGNTPEELLARIHDSLLSVTSLFDPFYINIYGTGAFPDRKYPRVIWTGIRCADIMGQLKHAVDENMSMLGFKKEDREFNPHLTLGRVRSRRGIVNILNQLDLVREKDFGSIHVEKIRLMKSDLRSGGPEYASLYEVPLGRESSS